MLPALVTRSSGKLRISVTQHFHVTQLTYGLSDVIPDSQKSTGQSLSDKASREKDSHKDESLLDKAKSAVGMDKK